MIVDLLRNDLAMVCEVGTVTVPALMGVESYEWCTSWSRPYVAGCASNVSTVRALRELFPAAFRWRAQAAHDADHRGGRDDPRGVYAGAFGWICGDGRADLGVIIRSLVATPAGNRWRYRLGTGGGITVRSDIAEEYAESHWKSDRLLRIFD